MRYYKPMNDDQVENELLQLLEHEVHVWYCRTDEEPVSSRLAALEGLLSAEELSRYRVIKHAKTRHSYLVSHAMLRSVLSGYVDRPEPEWQFVRGQHGKPHLRPSEDVPDIRFNLTHTDGLCACVFSLEHECGIDVERHGSVRRIEAVAQRMFSDEECAQLAANGYEAEMFNRFWTLREAYLKALGIGLSGSSKSFRFELSVDSSTAGIFHREEPEEGARWCFRLFEPVPGFQLSVALESPPKTAVSLRSFSFD